MSKIPTPADQARELTEYFIQSSGHEKHLAKAGIKRVPTLLWIALNSEDEGLRELGRNWLAQGAAMCSPSQRIVATVIRGAAAAMNESINISATPGTTFITSSGDNRSEIKDRTEKPKDGPIAPLLSAKFGGESKGGGKE